MPKPEKSPTTQQSRAVALLRKRGMLRLADLKRSGITAATISRLEKRGKIVRLARGLYQLPDASLHAHHASRGREAGTARCSLPRFGACLP